MSLQQVVWKHTIGIGATATVYFPPSARVTMTRVDRVDPQYVHFWVAHPEPGEVDPDVFRENLATFEIVATGQSFPLDWEVVSSCADPERPLIWHLARHA